MSQVEVWDLLRTKTEPVTVPEIAMELGYNTSSIYKFLHGLKMRGVIITTKYGKGHRFSLNERGRKS
jgi:predicted transcriptional regulator